MAINSFDSTIPDEFGSTSSLKMDRLTALYRDIVGPHDGVQITATSALGDRLVGICNHAWRWGVAQPLLAKRYSLSLIQDMWGVEDVLSCEFARKLAAIVDPNRAHEGASSRAEAVVAHLCPDWNEVKAGKRPFWLKDAAKMAEPDLARAGSFKVEWFAADGSQDWPDNSRVIATRPDDQFVDILPDMAEIDRTPGT